MSLLANAALTPVVAILASLVAAPSLARAADPPLSQPAAAATAASISRVAIVVGANQAAPGRKPLRFAHRDAKAVANVLQDLAGFAPKDVHLLLDPEPDAILHSLDRVIASAAASSSPTMLLFYYSGHADTASLFPSGKTLALRDLKQRLEDPRIQVRMGLIDACRGGGWTGSKGLEETTPFNLGLPMDITSEGSVLIASSSGVEDAHESEALRGSFFTHHWNAGLRGAADRNRDRQVSVGEAFEYAKALTIRDTALVADTPQHPSFRMNLRGRTDLAISSLAAGQAVVELNQTHGPLQVIHLRSGILVAEIPTGARKVSLALGPGRYLVKRRDGDTTFAREITVTAGQTTRVHEENLELVGNSRLAIKGGAGNTVVPSQLDDGIPPSEWMLGFAYTRATYLEDLGGTLDESDIRNEPTHLRWLEISGSYLWRTSRHFATRLGAGFWLGEPSSDGSLYFTIGETLSAPLKILTERVPGLSPHAIEPYLTAQLKAGLDLKPRSEQPWIERARAPVQLNGALAAGIRFYALYVQVGYGANIYPKSAENDWIVDNKTTYSERIHHPQLGIQAEVGFRFVRNFH